MNRMRGELAVLDGRAASEGWPDWISIPSKVGQVASGAA